MDHILKIVMVHTVIANAIGIAVLMNAYQQCLIHGTVKITLMEQNLGVNHNDS
ncbi:MAG: hypothetical protein JXA96_07215 [Sedimentisphaerales bacterium]|nr:hypothetical protein [Sedimentisphaerales bacterium]